MRDSDTVEALRRRVARERRFELAELTVVFAGRRLDDGLTLSDYNVRHDSCVHVQARKGVPGAERGCAGILGCIKATTTASTCRWRHARGSHLVRDCGLGPRAPPHGLRVPTRVCASVKRRERAPPCVK